MRNTRVVMVFLSMAFSSGAFALHDRTVLEGHCKVGGDSVFLSFQLDENSSKSMGFAVGGLSNLVYGVTAEFLKKDDASYEASFRIKETDRLTGKTETIGSFSSINNEDGSPIVGNKLFLQRQTAISTLIITCLGKVINRPIN